MLRRKFIKHPTEHVALKISTLENDLNQLNWTIVQCFGHVAPTEMLVSMEEMLSRVGQYEKFQAFVQRLSEVDDIWVFWNQFVFEDWLAYVGPFLSTHCQNWKLRIASLKLMAPLFIAYDCTIYQQLIPNHLADIQSFPACILKCVEKEPLLSVLGDLKATL